MSMIMLDLETMGNTTNAAIIAIGAVSFNLNGIKSEFYEQVSLKSAVRNGGVIDPATVIWWMKQSDAARSKFFDNEYAKDVSEALIDFAIWMEQEKAVEVWGCGASFDNVILAGAYDRSGIPRPWKFWNDRCYRTIRDMNPRIPFERVGTHHNALDDAKSQALHLIKILKENK